MYGYLTLCPARRSLGLNCGELCGLPVLRAEVSAPEQLSGKRLERRIHRAAVRLWEHGVSYVLVPPGFPWWPTLRTAGLAPVKTEELCRAAAAPLALAALTARGWEPERAVVSLAGRRVTTAMLRAAEILARQVCRLIVEVPDGGNELAEYLREEYGLPVLLPGTMRPALTVVFDASWQGQGAALRLWGEQPDLLGTELWVPGLELPPDCETLSLLAALWECGRLSGGALLAKPLDIPR